MVHESVGPLLRGIGSSIILVGTLIGYVAARQELHVYQEQRQGQSQVASAGKGLLGALRNSERNNDEMKDQGVAERLVENRWFEFLGFVGAAVVSSSFYVEYLSRRNGKSSSGQRITARQLECFRPETSQIVAILLILCDVT